MVARLLHCVTIHLLQVGWKYSLAKNRFTLLLTDEPLDNG